MAEREPRDNMIASVDANRVLRAVARYGVAEHLMARELYAPGTVTHGAAQRCEQALAEVHNLVWSLVDHSGRPGSAEAAELDPAMIAVDAALVEMNTYTANLLAKLREVGVDTDTIPRTHHAFFPEPPPSPPANDEFSYLNEYGQRRT
jgi:hypothetical protein